MGFGDWLDERAKAKAARERQEARIEKKEWIEASYEKILKCGNCGKTARVRIRKGSSVAEHAATLLCVNCDLTGKWQ